MKIKKIIIGIIAAMTTFVGQAESSAPFRLSLKHDGVRQSAGEETLTYSSQWDGGEGASVTIAQDGVAIAEGLSGEDAYDWSVSRNGTYVLTHTTYANGIVGKVETATFVVIGKDVPFGDSDVTINGYSGKYDGLVHGVVATSEISGFKVKYSTTKSGAFVDSSPTIKNAGTMTVWCELSAPGYVTTTNSATVTILPREMTLTSGSASKVYDGAALTNGDVAISGDGFVSGEGATYNVTGSQTSVGSSENTFAYTFKDGTKAANYTITTQTGLLTVTPATIGGGASGGEEPGNGIVPQGGLSKFDTTVMYDGKAHTIDTNALLAVTLAGSTPEFSYALAEAGPWQSMPFVYTNVCTTSFWYKISAENYQDYIHEARVTITNRPITITSGNGSWVYDGLPHSNTAVTIDGLADGDAVETKNFATITEVGTEANSFDYEFSDGTLASNYAVTCVAGQLSVIAANMDDWVDASKWSVTLAGNNAKYDGTEKVCAVSALSYDGIAIPTFAVTGNTATDAGNYTLTVAGTGNYSGTHTFEWSILPREVTLTSASASKVYDGTALVNGNVVIGGDGFVSGEGATFTVTGSQTSVGSSENTFVYTFKDGTKAENYTVATQMGLLTVTAASIGGGASGGEEPGNGIVPQGGLSKFDTTVMYDGKAHTIDTNALLAVTLAGSTPVFSYALAEAGPWQPMPFVYTNVCTTSFWYKISAVNYNDYIHEARLTISPRTGVVVDIIGNVATNMFDNAQQSVSGYQVSINDPLYSESDFEFIGSDTVSKIAAGVYPMGLSATQFANTNVNFTDVVFNVTDGELVVLALPEKNVIFDALGGALAAGEGVVTQKCDAVYRAMPSATREGYRFEGWYLGVTNAAPEAAEGAALLVNEEHTLFAKWGVDVSIMPGGESIFKWESVSLDTVRILGFKDSLQTVDTLVFPDTIDGKAVVEIATGAFANSKSGMRKVILPIFCTRIGDKAFNGVSSLAEIKFVNARQWSNPSCIAELDIGRYAFAGVGVCSLMLPASVAEIGDYAFANCKSLSAITILGQPAIGLVPFRRAGMNTDGIIVHLDPALANDTAYMDSLKQECASVTVRADAVVTGIALSQLSLAADEISLSVSVEKAASWGTIDPLAVKVSFRKILSDEPLILDPISVVENEDGSLTVKVASQGTESGFFQVVYLK